MSELYFMIELFNLLIVLLMSSEKGSILNFFSKSKKTANEVALEIDSHRRVLPQSSLKKTQPKSIVSLHTKTDQQSTSDCLQQPNPLESIAPVEMKSPPITQTSISMLPSYRARPSSAEGQRKRPKSGWASKVTQTTEIESTKRTRERFDLTDEQKAAVQVVLSGRSVFLTGGAGTGKSYTLTAIIWKLREVYGSKKVFVTASTGLAASAISGTTVHFFSGLGIGGGTPSQMLAKVQRNHDAVSRWQKAQVLIIDEISMIDADLFDALDHIACGLRENDHPMGGLQLVLCGDFLQLPPVNAERFAFESNAWKRLAPINLLLKLSMRQLSDSVFASILDQVRRGCLSDEVKNALESRLFAQLTSSSPGVEATSLFPRRSEADERNKQRLEALDGESYQFTAVDSGTEPYLSQLRSNCSAPTILQLKIGAQVCFI